LITLLLIKTHRRRTNSPLRAESRALRERSVLDAAARVLVQAGATGLTVRAVADEAGASTMVLYTLFGGRDGLLDALCRDGLARLGAALARGRGRSGTGATVVLYGLAARYRRFALCDPPFYHALSIVLRPGPLVRASDAFQFLVDAVEECMSAGELAPADPELVADALWALVHGLVSLELGGHFASAAAAERCFAAAGAAILDGFRRGA
jgi:AcrR family transcriptional regulator